MGFPYTFPITLVWRFTKTTSVDTLVRGSAVRSIGLDVLIGEIPAESRKFMIEIRDLSGNLVDILENAYDVIYGIHSNAMPSLDFQMPADDPKKLGIDRDKEIWLRNYRTDTVIAKFRPALLFDRR